MIENIVTQAVSDKWIVEVITTVGDPVLMQLFRAENKDRLVSVLVILDYGKSGERLTETHGVGKDAAVILFEFVDDCESRVTLEVVELVPDYARFEAGGFVRQYVL